MISVLTAKLPRQNDCSHFSISVRNVRDNLCLTIIRRMYQLSMSSVLQQLAWAGGRAGILTDNWFTGANIAAIFVLMRTKNHK